MTLVMMQKSSMEEVSRSTPVFSPLEPAKSCIRKAEELRADPEGYTEVPSHDELGRNVACQISMTRLPGARSSFARIGNCGPRAVDQDQRGTSRAQTQETASHGGEPPSA